MSKTDELRAMREAKYARARAYQNGTQPAPPKLAAVPPVPVAPEPTEPPEGQSAAEPDTGLCGHRSMNGRTCTREAGHAAKSHRYS